MRITRRRPKNPVLFQDEQCVVIELTQGKTTIIDADDYESVGRIRWQAARGGNTWYAKATVWNGSRWVQAKMHRLITGAEPSEAVDHINGNGLDNRRGNLRRCSNAENIRNSRLRRDSSSGFKGVHQHLGKWQARMTLRGKRVSLGHFESPVEAAQAYDDSALKHYGEFARLNFPCDSQDDSLEN